MPTLNWIQKLLGSRNKAGRTEKKRHKKRKSVPVSTTLVSGESATKKRTRTNGGGRSVQGEEDEPTSGLSGNMLNRLASSAQEGGLVAFARCTRCQRALWAHTE